MVMVMDDGATHQEGEVSVSGGSSDSSDPRISGDSNENDRRGRREV